MAERRFFLYDSADAFCNDIIQELKNNNLLSTFQLIDKQRVDISKLNPILKQCLLKCNLPAIIVPNITMPIERPNVRAWIKSTQLFDIKTNNVKNKDQPLTEPSPQDKLGIAVQEIKKISDVYTFIDDKNTEKSYEGATTNKLILNESEVTTSIVDETEKKNNEQRIRLIRMINKHKR
jgi:hypothetical protein